MKKKEIRTLTILAIFSLLTIISFFFDNNLMLLIEGQRNIFFDYILLGFTLGGNIFIIFFFLNTLLLWQENKRRWIIPLWLSVLFSFLISFLIKIIIHRKRPFETGLVSILGIVFNFMKNSFLTWDFSFPSMHAMFVFAALPILDKEFKRFRYVWIVFAVLVALSRVYFGAHYVSDVLAGAIIGYLIGYIMVLIEERYGLGKKLFNRTMY